MRTDPYRLGPVAAELAFARIDGERATPRRLVVPGRAGAPRHWRAVGMPPAGDPRNPRLGGRDRPPPPITCPGFPRTGVIDASAGSQGQGAPRRGDPDPALQVPRPPRADAGRAGRRGEHDPRAHRRSPCRLHRAGAARVGGRHRRRRRRLAGSRRRRVLPQGRRGFGRQLGHDAVLPDRAGGARRPPGDDHRTAVLQAPADRSAAARPAAPRRQGRLRGPEPAGHRPSRPTPGRPHPHRRHALTVDQRPADARAVRRGSDDDRGLRRPQRARFPRADGRHDAPVRARGRCPRGLAPIRHRAPGPPAGRRRSCCRRTSARRRSDCRHAPFIPRR